MKGILIAIGCTALVWAGCGDSDSDTVVEPPASEADAGSGDAGPDDGSDRQADTDEVDQSDGLDDTSDGPDVVEDAPEPAPELEFSQEEVDFGTREEGETVTKTIALHNNGMTRVTGISLEIDAPFEVSGCSEISEGRRCTVNVDLPMAAAGMYEGVLSALVGGEVVASVDVRANVLERPFVEFTITPSQVEFADRITGRDGEVETRAVTLSNSGNAILRNLRLRPQEQTRGFEFDFGEGLPGFLRAGETYVFHVRFVALLEGEYQSLAIFDADHHPVSVSVQGAVRPPEGPAALVLTGETDFGSLRLFQSREGRMTIRNLGGERASLGVFEHSNEDEFRIDDQNTTCRRGVGFAPGRSCVLEIDFVPAFPGARRAEIRIPYGEQTLTIELTGTGLGSHLEPDVAHFDIPDGDFGHPSAPVSVEYTNVGNRTTSSIEFPTHVNVIPVGHDCGVRLAPGASCTARFSFVPTFAARNTITYTPLVDDREQVTLSFSGRGEPQEVQLSRVEFDSTEVETASEPQPVAIQNLSQVGIRSLSLSTSTTEFSIQSHTCGDALAPGATCQAQVVFTPNEFGRRVASLSVFSFGRLLGSASMVGTSIPRDIELTLDPDAHQFRPRDGEFESVTIRVTNTGGETSAPLETEFVHQGRETIEIVSNDCEDAVLEPGEEGFCTIVLRLGGRVGVTGNLRVTVSSRLGGSATGSYGGFVVP